jgi:hypothetical protein
MCNRKFHAFENNTKSALCSLDVPVGLGAAQLVFRCGWGIWSNRPEFATHCMHFAKTKSSKWHSAGLLLPSSAGTV